MKIKFKKLWLLYDGKEVIEDLEENYNLMDIGKMSLSMYCGKIGATEGTYIIMPVNGDINIFRTTLVKYLIKREQIVIDKANSKIQQLINKL